MQNKKDFVLMCEQIKSSLKNLLDINNLTFALQTNGMLIDEEWIEIFQKYNIGIGISLDGDKEANDRFRVDKNGRGTYDKVVEKIKLCQKFGIEFGLLSVVNPNLSGRAVYKHFVHDLGLRHFDFLLPDANYNSRPIYQVEKYGEFMAEVFEEWSRENSNSPFVFIRFCVNIIECFLGRYSRIEGIGKRSPHVLPLICVSNNGDLGPLDELRTCVPEEFTKANIANTTWRNFVANPFITQFLIDMNDTPVECKSCCWENLCRGGQYAHRYNDNTRSFSNKSIYCEALKIFYAKVLHYLLNNGYSKQEIEKYLAIF